MSVIDNIDCATFRSALQSCKDSLGSINSIDNLPGEISGNGSWIDSSKGNLSEAIAKLKGTRYPELRGKIDEYLAIVSSIETYKSLKEEKHQLEIERDSIDYWTTTTYIDEDGKKKSTSVIDSAKYSEYLHKNDQIREKEKQIDSLEKSIRTSLGI